MVLLFNKFFPIVNTCLICEDIVGQSCTMVPRWRIFWRFFLGPAFPASHVQHISDMHPKFALRPPMRGSMVDIQSPTAEIRRGKKKKKEENRNHRAKISYPHLLHRAAITTSIIFSEEPARSATSRQTCCKQRWTLSVINLRPN